LWECNSGVNLMNTYCRDVGEVWVGAWGKFGCAAK
jgi:hypothetical protein